MGGLLQGDRNNGDLWTKFREAWAFAQKRDFEHARRVLLEIVEQPGHESRHYAQAWHFLREVGHSPSQRAKHVLGTIVEVGMPKGLDVLGAYEDHTARYWNFSGSGAVWERPSDSLDVEIDALLDASHTVVGVIGPHAGPHPPPPATGSIQVSFLTPGGLHFGNGPADAFGRDPLAGPVIARGAQLIQKLTRLCSGLP